MADPREGDATVDAPVAEKTSQPAQHEPVGPEDNPAPASEESD